MKHAHPFARPQHLLPHLPRRQANVLDVDRGMFLEVVDAALPYGKRLLLMRRHRRLTRSGVRVA